MNFGFTYFYLERIRNYDEKIRNTASIVQLFVQQPKNAEY